MVRYNRYISGDMGLVDTMCPMCGNKVQRYIEDEYAKDEDILMIGQYISITCDSCKPKRVDQSDIDKARRKIKDECKALRHNKSTVNSITDDKYWEE